MGFNTNYNVGGVVDRVKRVDLVAEVGGIKGFPTLSQPYNRMVTLDIPSVKGDFEIVFTTPDETVEVMAVTVSCTGYSERDRYDLFCNDEPWYQNWFVSEMNEALFLGTSTFVYSAPPDTVFKLVYRNDSGCSKNVKVGFRMLKGPKLAEIEQPQQ